MVLLRYDALNRSQNEIRLLSVLPKTYDAAEEAPLSCELFHVSLDENPEYVALSYAWGDDRGTKSIYLGATMIKIPRNLYSALCHLRGGMMKISLWVDFLCIKQTDDEEIGRASCRER